MKKIKEIEQTAEKLGLDIESYEVFDPRYNIETVEALRTDTCKFLGFGVCAKNDEQIADWGIVTPEEYNSTIYANCGDTQENNVIVVVINRKD